MREAALREWQTSAFHVGASSAARFLFFRSAAGPARRHAGLELAAQTQALDQHPIPIRTGPPQIVEQAAALTHEVQQTAARVMVLRVQLEVLGELVDPFRQQRHLDFR
jgi:hypothetical protein